MLLYLDNHSRPDISNATQELSRDMDGVNQAAFLKMHHVIKYVLNTRNNKLELEPSMNEKEPWDILCFNNSDYTGDSYKEKCK